MKLPVLWLTSSLLAGLADVTVDHPFAACPAFKTLSIQAAWYAHLNGIRCSRRSCSTAQLRQQMMLYRSPLFSVPYRSLLRLSSCR